MNLRLLPLILLVTLICPVRGAVIVTERGGEANLFNREPPYLTDATFDLNRDGVPDFRFAGDFLVAVVHGFNGNRLVSMLSAPPDLGADVLPVQAGAVLGLNTLLEAGDWLGHADNGGYWFGLFLLQYEDAYIGVEFQAADGVHYGWIQYTGYGVPQFPAYDENGNFQGFYLNWDHPGGMINSWAWETEPGKAIVAGVVPEPSAALLSLSAAVFSLLRRRRRPA